MELMKRARAHRNLVALAFAFVLALGLAGALAHTVLSSRAAT